MKAIKTETLEAIKAANGYAINVSNEFDSPAFFTLNGEFLGEKLYLIRDSIENQTIICIQPDKFDNDIMKGHTQKF